MFHTHTPHSATSPEPRHIGKAVLIQFSGKNGTREITKKVRARYRACWAGQSTFSFWEKGIKILAQGMIKVLLTMFCLFCYLFSPMRIAITNLDCQLLRKWGDVIVSHWQLGSWGRNSRAVLTRRGEQAETCTWRRKKENHEPQEAI